MHATNRIEINPDVMMGKPVIRGTGIRVELILRWLPAPDRGRYPRRSSLRGRHTRSRRNAHSRRTSKALTGVIQFLADESCVAVVHALRQAGHDVIAVAEVFPWAEDPNILERG